MAIQSDPIQNTAFDPADGVFIAQDSRPATLGDVSVGSLSPFVRALLIIDGTVTKYIEAYTNEPVAVLRLEQTGSALGDDHQWLDAPRGARIIHRQSMLVGDQTGCLRAYAESLIVVERLSPAMQKGLDSEPGGLGKILFDSGIETRREGLWFGREQLTDLPGSVAELCDGDFLTRTYRVIAGGVPLMMITERFPFNGDFRTGNLATVD
jgi:chorismate-pyruvate lyase